MDEADASNEVVIAYTLSGAPMFGILIATAR